MNILSEYFNTICVSDNAHSHLLESDAAAEFARSPQSPAARAAQLRCSPRPVEALNFSAANDCPLTIYPDPMLSSLLAN